MFLNLSIFNTILCIPCPNNLGSYCHHLSRFMLNPFYFILICPIKRPFIPYAYDPFYCLIHLFLELLQPLLYIVFGHHNCLQLHLLLFRTHYPLNQITLSCTLTICHHQLHQSFKALS